MIRIRNDNFGGEWAEVEDKYFPDNTFAFRCPIELTAFRGQEIEWRYEKETEMVKLYYIVKYIQSKFPCPHVKLILPYIPNARMDRIKNDDEIFTLKFFAEFINSLNFDEVLVRDPHSNVSAALINNIVIDNAENFIQATIKDITKTTDENFVIYYPDEGAMKRYSDLIKDIPYTFGVKKRDWRTGKILGIKVIDKDIIKNQNILLIDDICSKGGTAYYSAKALKEAGAKDIYLYFTHCENTIHKGELLKGDLIKHIYTTDSLKIDPHDKITVFDKTTALYDLMKDDLTKEIK